MNASKRLPFSLRCATLATLTFLTATIGCGGPIDDQELDEASPLEEAAPEAQADLETRQNALSDIYVERQGSGHFVDFVIHTQGPRNAWVKFCIKEQDNPDVICSQGDDHIEWWAQLGVTGNEHWDWFGRGSFWRPNWVEQLVRFRPRDFGWPTCDTTYEFLIKDSSEPWHTIQHKSTFSSSCPDGGYLVPEQGGYPAACVLGGADATGTTGFVYNGHYYYKPVSGIAGPCPDGHSTFDGLNCRMDPPFPAVPAGRTGLVIWPATFAYEAACE